jgi:hypothetical protein
MILLALLAAEEVGAGGGGTMILWPGSDAYDERVEDLPLSPEEAHARLVDKTRDHPERFFDRAPIFIVDDEYFFSEPAKIEIPLQGFYVNGRTGVIEYRKSEAVIHAKEETLPAHPFTESTVID